MQVIEKNKQRCIIDDANLTFVFSNKLEVEDLKTVLNTAEHHLKKNQKTKLYVDVSDLKEVSIHSRRLGVSWIKSNKSLLKIAVYSSTVFMYYFVNMIILGAGANQSMRIFKSKKEAMAWLME